jgi:glycosyltransferase involved in cell wall biosynthesis
MRLVLLLHPSFCFPHPLESFPMDRHFFHWLDQRQENHLIIIGSTLVTPPVKYRERIISHHVPYTQPASFFSSALYIWKAIFHLKKNQTDRILFDGIDTFLFFSKNRWMSFLFHRVMKKPFLILQHGFRGESAVLPAEKKINIQELPSPAFENSEDKSHDLIKSLLTNGAEYFLCSAHFTSPQQLTFLLKAYSVFKQRLKTNFKLVLSGIQTSNIQCITLLSNYKFRQDVIIPSPGQYDSFSSVLFAAYAHIFSSSDMYYPCTPADCAVTRVPVISPYNRLKDIVVSNEFTFSEGDVQDLAEKMMRIYKDEGARKDAIKNMYACFLQAGKTFDFSAHLQNAPR